MKRLWHRHGIAALALLSTLMLLPARSPAQEPSGPPGEAMETQLVTIPSNAGLPDGSIELATRQVFALDGFGITINPGAGLVSNAAALAAFNRAANQWLGRIADPITVTINANLANLGSANVVGTTNAVFL